MFGRSDDADITRGRPVRLVRRTRASSTRGGLHVPGGHGLDERHVPERPPGAVAPSGSRWPTRSASATANTATRSSAGGPPHRRAGRAAPTLAASAARTRTRSCVRPPLFAVADGMGGAKAGEVASAVAAEARSRAPASPASPPEAQLAGIVREANRRIYDLAVADESPPRHGHHAHARQGARRRGEPRATWATAAPTACATASSSSSRATTRWSPSSSAAGRSRRRRPSTTRSARSSRARSGPSRTWRSTPTRSPGATATSS